KVTGKLLTLDGTLGVLQPALLALLETSVDDQAWRALEPAERRQRSIDAVRRLLLREAREQPLLVIVEDLHWIDSESQAVLDGLVEALESARMLLVVNYRPEFVHDWASRSHVRQIHVAPLARTSADELIGSLLGTDTTLDDLKQLLIARTNGNPF